MDAKIRQALAPTGVLRAAINLGNPLLASRTSPQVSGISVDLARELAGRLQVPLALISFDSARDSVAAVAEEQTDIGFFAIDEKRAPLIAFTGAYLQIEACFLVLETSAIADAGAVDCPGVRVVVGGGSAYDLFLSRHLKQAQIVRTLTSAAVVDVFLAENLEVAAGVRQQLENDMRRHETLRLLDDPFMVIGQAMALPRSRHEAAHGFLAAFVEEARAGGFLHESMVRHGITGAAIAPGAGG